jgi:hypothetical protein
MANQKSKFRDLHKIPADGYLIFPLSMSRLSNTQNADICYEALKFFEKKLEMISLDVVFLYTNGLYFNNIEPALDVRKRTISQMLAHKGAILRKILKYKKYVPQAFHFIPWDYIILNSKDFENFFNILKEHSKKDEKFRDLIIQDLNSKEVNEANINFLIEEIVVTHIIRQKLIDLPKTLVRKDNFRLIVYPGEYIKADFYQWKNKFLPQKKDFPFYASHYDLNKKIIYNFDEMEI